MKRPITLEDCRWEVTTNLEAGLRHLRDTANVKILWIDAICLYQDRYRTKCCRNLRFEPLFCERVGFAHFPTRISVRLLEPERALTTLCLSALFTHTHTHTHELYLGSLELVRDPLQSGACLES
jgi:hypothetical protein